MISYLIAFIGPPGSGKTTLACAMKEYCLHRKVSADICTEYAREYCFQYGIPKQPFEQYLITPKQMEREDCLLKGSNKFIFTDSPIFLGYNYALMNVNTKSEKRDFKIIEDMYQKFVLSQLGRYLKIFYLKQYKIYDDGCRDIENKKISLVIDGFISSHRHLLPIVDINIQLEKSEQIKKFVFENIRYFAQ